MRKQFKVIKYKKLPFSFKKNEGNPTRKDKGDEENLGEIERIPLITGKDNYQIELKKDSFDPIDRTGEKFSFSTKMLRILCLKLFSNLNCTTCIGV